MKRPEQNLIHKPVIKHLEARAEPGVWWCHIPNSSKLGGKRTKNGIPIEAIILKALGLQAGAPDLLLVKGGRAYFLEFKVKGRSPSISQINCHSALRLAGAEVHTAYGLDEALAWLEQQGLLKGQAQTAARAA